MINNNRYKHQQDQGIPSIFSMLNKPQRLTATPVSPHQELKGKLAKGMQDNIESNVLSNKGM